MGNKGVNLESKLHFWEKGGAYDLWGLALVVPLMILMCL